MTLTRMPRFARRLACVGGCLLWAIVVAFGFNTAMGWDYRPGLAGVPIKNGMAPVGKPRLILALHSQCPCTLAALDNLIALPPQERAKVKISLIFTGPDAHHSPSVDKARALPEAEQVFLTEDEVLKRYGARTSGQALVYDASGKLVFSGGLTDSRGEAGDSAGMRALSDVIAGRRCVPKLPVYGCALQTPHEGQ